MEELREVISKAVESCQNAGSIQSDHFVEANKSIKVGKGAQNNIKDFLLSRYACYLIAQNGDPAKQEIAFAQAISQELKDEV